MVIFGFLVFNESGVTFYSKVLDLNINIDHILFGNFLSTINIFLKKINVNSQSGIKSMKIHNFNIKYRYIENYTFIALTEPKEDLTNDELILEYMIMAFLSIFKEELKKDEIIDVSKFNQFDEMFLKFRNAEEEILKKYLMEINKSYLLKLINQLRDYFPVSNLVNINSKLFKLINNELIWVSHNITQNEEIELINKLKKLIIEIYGSKVLKEIENNTQS